MLDLFHVPGAGEIGNTSQDVFYGSGTNATAYTNIWLKPRGKSMCHIFAVGSGGNGGNGFLGAASAAGGGGGGGSGSQLSLTLPLWALPDMMLIFVPRGGYNADLAFYLPDPGVILFNISSGTSGGNGTAITAGTGGATPAAPAININLTAMLSALMTTNVGLVGQNGSNGGSATLAGVGVQVTYPTTGLVISGGAGGGGIGTTANGGAGGAVNTNATYAGNPTILGGVSSVGAGDNGNAGIRWPFGNLKRMLNSGGSGGAGSAFNSATSGGNGGDGGWGCGGGGGGACLTGGVAGKGGNGGPGLVIITCW